MKVIQGGLHGQPGLYSLAGLPQRRSISETSFDTGWWELDQIFTFYPGQFVMCTGLPGHGKSTFILNVLVNIAKKHGARSFLYAPENEAHLRAKLQRIWGCDRGFDDFCENQCFIQSAVPIGGYDEPARDLQWVLNQAISVIEKSSVDFLLIDPWNELEWAKRKDQLMTEYISECLKYLKGFARIYNTTVILIAHPTKARVAGSGPPTLADIEGSMQWYNKCDNGLIVERKKDNTTAVISAKVREFGAGKLGACFFHVDPETERFTPMHGAVDARG